MLRSEGDGGGPRTGTSNIWANIQDRGRREAQSLLTIQKTGSWKRKPEEVSEAERTSGRSQSPGPLTPSGGGTLHQGWQDNEAAT